LLKCCGGRENLPVSISLILGFNKMRAFKPRSQVVVSLRKSTFLELTPNSRQIYRKVPLLGKCRLDPDYEDDQEIAYARPAPKIASPVERIPKTKVKHPDGITKNMLKPTGFEKTFIEPPLTPKEAEEEEAMYSSDKAVVDRFELAIQRYKQKKRMHEMYAHVFNKLMRFGGVESGPCLFQGLSKHEMKEMETEELKEGMTVEEIGICIEEAKIKFGTGIAVLVSDEQYELFETSGFKVLSKETA
jgi:hypothetical protein